MADTFNKDKWPLVKFYYVVNISGDDDDIGDIAFQEVSGLDQETEVIEYRHGDSHVFSPIKRPGMIKFTDVTCKKGMFKGDERATKLFTRFITDKSSYAKRVSVTIKLLDEGGEVLVQWDLKNAFPKKLSGTDLKSDSNEIAIETLEFAHEGLTTKVVS